MITEIIISHGIVCLIGLVMLIAYRDPEEIRIRVCCYIVIAIYAIAAGIECYTIFQLRQHAEEIHLCYKITLDGNIHYPRRKAIYVQQKTEDTYSIYNHGNHLLLDSVDYIGVRSIPVNEQDTFDLMEYVAPSGDTLLYDAFLDASILPEQFEPHYEESI